MQNPKQRDERRDAISKLAVEANLSEVAEWLGLHVVGRGTRSPKTLCPFHEDRRPSLHLYSANSGARSQFHCYACGAHGDVFDLVKKQLSTDFRGALDWLSERYHFSIPAGAATKRIDRLEPRKQGLDLAFQIYRRQSNLEIDALKKWSADRSINFAVLEAAEVFVVFPPKIAKDPFVADRERLDSLENAGLLLRGAAPRSGESVPLPVEMPPRDFFRSPRVIFTIRDDRGAIAGFSGRAIGKESPKYLFSPGFARGSTLYRFHKVRAARPPRGSKAGKSVVHLFVVEGLMDSLRLESFGLNAVALLGSQITANQVRLLTEYARELDRNKCQLAVHLLLDCDEAGRRGAVNATMKLLEASVDTPGMLLDVLVPAVSSIEETGRGHDPDELFRDVQDSTVALARLTEWCESPMKVLLATALDISPKELDSTWEQLPAGQRLQAFHDVERRLDRARWKEILDRVPAFDHHLRDVPREGSSWQDSLLRFLCPYRGGLTSPVEPVAPVAKDDHGRLIRALQIAEASTQRREFPVDEGSWDRLQAAIDVTIPHLCALLELDGQTIKRDTDKMLSVLVPKGNGEFRLKALPSPEVLSVQQYVLNELLRDYADCPRFRRLIPAVRFTTNGGTRRLETTGLERLLPVGGEAVSFAYALDMDVIEHRAPPRRTGMFRSYFDCWRDFISFIDNRVAAFPAGKYHVARLDVRRFYNTVTRPVINAVLLPAVSDALAALVDQSEGDVPPTCARLFRPAIEKPKERAVAIVDWLCDQSFDYEFEQPGTIHQENPGGLPQGPDLSAYLANISLFPLDRALSEIVAKLDRQACEDQGEPIEEGKPPRVRGAVYARYVDDMVIIARTGQDLARMRTAIEQQLSLVGMELSPKTDPLPVMDETGVRDWLTNGRGAALGVSGPFEGPPSNTPLSQLEPLADAGETDRSDSLRVLHDPRLDDPETLPEELESAVEVALASPELRHGDKANAARHLWRSLIQRQESSVTTAMDVASRFIELWSQFGPSRQQTEESPIEGVANFTVSDLLAGLDGVERFLTSRPDRNPTFSDEDHRKLSELRERMAKFVHEGLCDFLIERVLPAGTQSRFENMLVLKRLVIHRAATLVVRPASSTQAAKIETGESIAKSRLLISLAESQEAPTLLDRAGWRASNAPLGILFHEAVARLRLANRADSNGPDPLTPLIQSMALWRQRGIANQPLERILHLWMPDSDTRPIDDVRCAEVALSAFVNLVPRRAVELIATRPSLRRFALDGSGGSQVRLLPVPPGLDVPGLIGLRDDERVVIRAEFEEVGHHSFCPQLSWNEKGGAPFGPLKRSESSLGGYQYLEPLIERDSHPSVTGWLARAFRSLVADAESCDQTQTCPPTASNLLGPKIGTDTADSEWKVLGFCVPAAKVSGQAFLRQGDDSLVLEPVLELNDRLWRIGTALADWLGCAQSTRQLSTQRLAAPALVLEVGEDWARKAMLHFGLCRLRGKSLPARPLRLSPASGLPMTVERALKRLEGFPCSSAQSTGYAGVAHLLATLAEGRAIQTRIDTRIDPATPGGGTALIADMVRGQFRADEELAHRLPNSDVPLAAWAPKRRPALALFAVAQRLTGLVDLDPMQADDPTLSALASGARLLSLEVQLRSQALELWSLLDIETQLRFQKSPPSLAEWNLDTTALLHREQPSPSEGASPSTDWRNVRDLFLKLHKATSDGQRVNWSVLAGITPLGWLVVLGALVGALSGDWRGSLGAEVQLRDEEREKLSLLAEQLAITVVDSDEMPWDDLPWGGFKDVISAWNPKGLMEALILLDRLDQATGLHVKICQGHRFSISVSRGRPTEVETSDGRRRLPSWAINWAKASNENRDGVERVPTPNNEVRVISRWTETWRGDQLVGMGVVQPAMVALAGNAFAETDVTNKDSISNISIATSTTSQTRENPSTVGRVELVGTECPPRNTVAARPSPPTVNEEHSSAKTPVSPCDSIRSDLFELESLQDKSWGARREKPQSHVRVALFQWDVDETYRHPVFDLCDNASQDFDRKKPENWNSHAYLPSCAEHRRRKILKSALKACGRFGVEILLLPEYSTRPDTVQWIEREASDLAPMTSVWAGTYRLPPGTTSRFHAWSSVHEVVLSERDGDRPARGKRYPAAAADEIFYPWGVPMEPLFSDQAIGDARSYVYELICSEAFLVTSPANLRPLARIRRDLFRKFNAGIRGDLDAMIEEDVLCDIKTFARHTGLSESLGIRRSIILVPAMTSRSADYTVLGQAGFLASGLTTVFCNAICGSYGHGQSCFIGHDGWLDEKEISAPPNLEPYHGARPGIFHLDHWNRGRLEKNEQALVIADIDPIYGPEGKPRPQALLRPMRLVAHLPIIETWQYDSRVSHSACRCGRVRQSMEADVFAPKLLEALKSGRTSGWSTTMDDSDPAILGDALQSLAECAGRPYGDGRSTSGWLLQRQKAYLSHHLSDPNPWPPPVALDWLWVDLGPTENGRFPEIEVPAYAIPPGGSSRDG